jgi:hypothetical protein
MQVFEISKQLALRRFVQTLNQCRQDTRRFGIKPCNGGVTAIGRR